MIGAAIDQLVSSVVPLDVTAGVRSIIDLCARDVAHSDWAAVRSIDFSGEMAALREWFDGALRSDPPPAPVRGLYLSLFNPITESGEATLDLQVVGTTGYTPGDRELNWLFSGHWFPDASARSAALHRLYGVAYRTHVFGATVEGALGNDCEWPVGLAYAVLSARAVLEGRTVADLPTDAAWVGVAAGWGEGDILLIGEISERGFTPVSST